MAIALRELNRQQLENLIDNHRKSGATDRPRYREALGELERRQGMGLDFDTSYRLIRAAARAGRFLSYKDLADGSGVPWQQAHYAMGGHLWRLVEYAHLQGWPMLSAIVVNKPNLTSGAMAPETLQGFVKAARNLGHDVPDAAAFLEQQQARVFAWARLLPEGEVGPEGPVD